MALSFCHSRQQKRPIRDAFRPWDRDHLIKCLFNRANYHLLDLFMLTKVHYNP